LDAQTSTIIFLEEEGGPQHLGQQVDRSRCKSEVVVGDIKVALDVKDPRGLVNQTLWSSFEDDLDLSPSQWRKLDDLWTNVNSPHQFMGKSIPTRLPSSILAPVHIVDYRTTHSKDLAQGPSPGGTLLNIPSRKEGE
jgi:hypothetical protein